MGGEIHQDRSTRALAHHLEAEAVLILGHLRQGTAIDNGHIQTLGHPLHEGMNTETTMLGGSAVYRPTRTVTGMINDAECTLHRHSMLWVFRHQTPGFEPYMQPPSAPTLCNR